MERKKLQIGNVTLENNLVLAPMAGGGELLTSDFSSKQNLLDYSLPLEQDIPY